MPSLLTQKQIKEAIRGLDGWKLSGRFLRKSFQFHEFTDAMRFVNSVAEVAEKLEHHPDIRIRYTTVTLALQTHSAGGVTRWDIQLARALDRLVRRRTYQPTG